MPPDLPTLPAWFFFADDDILSARALMKEGIWNQVCFHSQQAVEKAIKGCLKTAGHRIPKQHSLIELHELLREQIAACPDFYDAVLFLDRFYIVTRYPDALVGSLPEGLPARHDAIKALEYAEGLVSLLKRLAEKS